MKLNFSENKEEKSMSLKPLFLISWLKSILYTRLIVCYLKTVNKNKVHNNWQAKITMIWGLHRIPHQFHKLCFHGYKPKQEQMLEHFKLQGNPDLTSTLYPIKKYSELTMTSLKTLLNFSPVVNWILKSKIRTCHTYKE